MSRMGIRESVAIGERLSNGFSADERLPELESQIAQNKIDPIIHQCLSDLWLLISDERIGEEEASVREKRDGRAFAMICGDQLRLLGSRISALDALRSVGVEMS